MTSTSPKTGLCLETCYRLPGTRPGGRVDHLANETVTPSCLPWCFLPTTLQLLRCRTFQERRKTDAN
jgi:hypothetical protein